MPSSNHPQNPSGGAFQRGPESSFLQHNEVHVAHNCHDADQDGFRHLLAHVVPRAYDSDDQIDAPKCHPNTRKAVLDHILDWILQTVTRVQWIMWLFGAAGAGKSAIMRSMVEICTQNDIPFASFFFFRADPTRNTSKSLVCTLLYQLLNQIPELKHIAIPKIVSDPLIFTKSLETQFKYLIFDPLRQLHSESPLQKMIVLMIDGLDECAGEDNRKAIIRILTEFIQSHDVPVIALFASRVETDISSAFRAKRTSDLLIQVPLDNRYLPDDDIRLFLRDSFADIHQTHLFSDLLEKDWPQPELLEEIVAKSSGQFIYASVVMKFVAASRLHPARQLEIVRGIRPSGALSPFAQLDALYRHIFSQVQDIDSVLSVLAYFIIGEIPRFNEFCKISRTTVTDMHLVLADLTSVLTVTDIGVSFLHASLPDFLRDPVRSQAYYIDKSKWCSRLSLMCLELKVDKDVNILRDIMCFLPHIECTPELRHAVSTSTWSDLRRNDRDVLIEYLHILKGLDFDEDSVKYMYNQQLIHITHIFLDKYPENLQELQSAHDITDILAQIEAEKLSKSLPDNHKSDTPSHDASVLALQSATRPGVHLGESSASTPSTGQDPLSTSVVPGRNSLRKRLKEKVGSVFRKAPSR